VSNFGKEIEDGHSPKRGGGGVSRPSDTYRSEQQQIDTEPMDISSPLIRVADLVDGLECALESDTVIEEMSFWDLESMSEKVANFCRLAPVVNSYGGDSVTPRIERGSRLLFLHAALCLKLLSIPEKRREMRGQDGKQPINWDSQIRHWRPIIEETDRRFNQPASIVTRSPSGRDKDVITEDSMVDVSDFPIVAYQLVVDDLVTILTTLRAMVKYSYVDLNPSERCNLENVKTPLITLKEIFKRILHHNITEMTIKKVILIPEEAAVQLGASPVMVRGEVTRPYLTLLAPRDPGKPLNGSLVAHGSYIHQLFHRVWLPHWGFCSDGGAIKSLPSAKLWFEILLTFQSFLEAALECEGLSRWLVDKELLKTINDRLFNLVNVPSTPVQIKEADDVLSLGDRELFQLIESAINIEKVSMPPERAQSTTSVDTNKTMNSKLFNT